MNKLYNTQKDITSGIRNFLISSIPDLRKTQANIIPEIIFGMISSESVVTSDIAKSLKDEFSLIKLDSVKKRINRLFNNDHFDGRYLLNEVVISILNNYTKKHKDKRIHITFDHMFSHDNYATFMFSMRVGTQGIPIYFECFKGSDNTDAFKIQTLKNGINAIDNLFKDKNFELIFLADRWFCSTELLEYIDSLGHTYCVRLKGNIHIYDFLF